MSNRVNVRFIQSKTIGQPDSLDQALLMINRDFEISILEVGSLVTERFAFWQHFDERVLKELHIAYQKRELSAVLIERKPPELGFLSLTMELSWAAREEGSLGKDRILFSADAPMYRNEEYGAKQNCRNLLEYVKHWYSVFSPGFGWIEICGASGYTSQEDVNQLLVPHIYWANFFSPAYVKKLGRDFLVLAPGWKVEFLEDGGCLYVLSPTMKATSKLLAQQVRQYFGIDAIRKVSKSATNKR